MSLEDAREDLKEGIKLAYINAAEEGGKKIAIMTIPNLAGDMRDAIHAFMLEATVATQVTTDVGQMDTAMGSSTAPATGFGAGKLL
jgi:hypothetical protein